MANMPQPEGKNLHFSDECNWRANSNHRKFEWCHGTDPPEGVVATRSSRWERGNPFLAVTRDMAAAALRLLRALARRSSDSDSDPPDPSDDEPGGTPTQPPPSHKKTPTTLHARLRGGGHEDSEEPRTTAKRTAPESDGTSDRLREGSVATVNADPLSPVPWSFNPGRDADDGGDSENDYAESRSCDTASTCDYCPPPSPDEGRNKYVRDRATGLTSWTWDDQQQNPWHDDEVEAMREAALAHWESATPPTASDTVQVFVHPCPLKKPFEIDLRCSVAELKGMIEAETTIPAPSFYLHYVKIVLEDHHTLAHYGIQTGSHPPHP
jgi:hypothetical protein